MHRLAIFLIVMLYPTAWMAADDSPETSEPATLREMIDASVDKMQVFGSEDAEPAKQLVALRWANNQRGSEDGMTLLYVHEGRPVAAACLYPWAGRLVHDFEAIGRDVVVARR